MNKITRRDFINGTLMVAGASLLPINFTGNEVMAKLTPSHYPPSLTGLRGSHLGSNTHAHDRAWTQKSDWGPTADVQESYDLIIVGGGISGLAAAYFYQQKHGTDKKVLILDNHDDFGGHAKRNEHTIDGQTLISYGGSQSIVEPKHASEVVHSLFNDVGVDVERFRTAYDSEFYNRYNLGAVTYFNKEAFGEDRVVKHPFCNYPNYVEGILMSGKLSNEEAARQAPLSKSGQEQLLRVLNGGVHMIDVPEADLAWRNNSKVLMDLKYVSLEAKQRADGKKAYVIGIGINCLQQSGHFDQMLSESATSLELACPQPVDRTAVAMSLLSQLDRWLADPAQWDDDVLRDAWLSHCDQIGGRIALRSGDGEIEGTVVDIDPTAALIVQLDTGGVRKFDAAGTTVCKMPRTRSA